MFEEAKNGETQYCSMCEEWAKKFEKIKEELENLTNEKNRILNLAKQNADSSEYCMRELEEQNNEFKIQNESLRNHISDLLQQLNELKEAQNEGN